LLIGRQKHLINPALSLIKQDINIQTMLNFLLVYSSPPPLVVFKMMVRVGIAPTHYESNSAILFNYYVNHSLLNKIIAFILSFELLSDRDFYLSDI